MIVAAVIFPAERRLVGELLGLDEVLDAQLGCIHAELVGQQFNRTLNGKHRFGDAERAAIGHTARGLVGVDAVDGQMSGGDVIGAGADVHETGRPFRRIGAGVEGAVVGEHMHAHGLDLAVFGGRKFRRHVIVAGKRRGGEVLHPVLDPLDRHAEHDGADNRADIAGIGADLVAEAAADIGGNDVDLVLGQARNQRNDGADDVRRLEGAPQRQFTLDLVEGRDRLAGFQR